MASKREVRTPYQIAMSSDKCDFRMFLPNASVRGSTDVRQPVLTAELPGAGLRASSSKCDWQISALSQAVLPETRQASRLRSDKCDFQVAVAMGRSYAEFVRRPLAVQLAGGHPAFGGMVASSKCDFQLVGTTPLRRAEVAATTDGIRLDAKDFRITGAVASSKCDFRLRGSFERVSFPEVTARMASDKCDFNLQIEFGMLGGQQFRIRAVGSSKCEFRLQDFRTRISDKEGWKRIGAD
jgi:hypothetical protein